MAHYIEQYSRAFTFVVDQVEVSLSQFSSQKMLVVLRPSRSFSHFLEDFDSSYTFASTRGTRQLGSRHTVFLTLTHPSCMNNVADMLQISIRLHPGLKIGLYVAFDLRRQIFFFVRSWLRLRCDRLM